MLYPAISGFERADRSDGHSTENRRIPVDSFCHGIRSYCWQTKGRPRWFLSSISVKRSITSSKARGYTPRVQSCRFRTHTAEPLPVNSEAWSLSLFLSLFLSLLSLFARLLPTFQSLTKWKQYWLANLTRELRIETILQFPDESDPSCIPL